MGIAPQRVDEDAHRSARRSHVFDLAPRQPVVDRAPADADELTRLHDRDGFSFHVLVASGDCIGLSWLRCRAGPYFVAWSVTTAGRPRVKPSVDFAWTDPPVGWCQDVGTPVKCLIHRNICCSSKTKRLCARRSPSSWPIAAIGSSRPSPARRRLPGSPTSPSTSSSPTCGCPASTARRSSRRRSPAIPTSSPSSSPGTAR